MNYITKKQHAKLAAHFAALVFSTIYIPGDERSRTNPDHGYPAENKGVVDYIAFDSREEMERWVNRAESSPSHHDYQILEVKPMTVTITSTVAVG